MGQIEPEHPELLALEFRKIAEYDSIIYKYQPISTKLGQNVCDHKIFDEFDYGFNRTRTVYLPLNLKIYRVDLFASAIIDQSVPNLATILYVYKVSDEFDYGTNRTSYFPMNLQKLLNLSLSTL